jgi:hypothetical protein
MNEHPIAVEFELTPEQIAKFGNLGRLARMDGAVLCCGSRSCRGRLAKSMTSVDLTPS